ncbi:hypothetical protein H0H87_007954 [Tephrocybe sp. NHM501043]|nr:hypothetical protein H0H87_007954 [Tephrocybe sp. NHM501043]
MPPNRELFVNSIGVDSYGNRGYDSTTPEVHRFQTWGVAAPNISKTQTDRYEALSICSKNSTVEEFGALPIKRGLEDLRIRLLEVCVGAAMTVYEYGRLLRCADRIPDYDEMDPILANLGRILTRVAITPWKCDGVNRVTDSPSDIIWVSSKVCLRLATHLTDDDVLRATVADIVDFVNPTSTDVIYGVALSFIHCVIVFIDMENEVIKHTPALEFLPSFYGSTPSTPGITAIARLGYLLDPLGQLDITVPAEHRMMKDLPVEVWTQITDLLFRVDDLISMASISSNSWSAANASLKYPRLGIKPYLLKGLQEDRPEANRLWTAGFCAESERGAGDLYLTPQTPGQYGFFYDLDYITPRDY